MTKNNMTKLFQVPASVSKITTLRGDKTIRLQVDTSRELTADEVSLLWSLYEREGWFLFKETEINKEDTLSVPDTSPEFKSDKTPSQRLRNVIYVFWDKNGAKGNFDDFYKKQIEKIITRIKDELDN